MYVQTFTLKGELHLFSVPFLVCSYANFYKERLPFNIIFLAN